MDEVCRLDQCIEMLLEAGADPFLILDPDDPESVPWICRNEENALSLVSSVRVFTSQDFIWLKPK